MQNFEKECHLLIPKLLEDDIQRYTRYKTKVLESVSTNDLTEIRIGNEDQIDKQNDLIDNDESIYIDSDCSLTELLNDPPVTCLPSSNTNLQLLNVASSICLLKPNKKPYVSNDAPPVLLSASKEKPKWPSDASIACLPRSNENPQLSNDSLSVYLQASNEKPINNCKENSGIVFKMKLTEILPGNTLQLKNKRADGERNKSSCVNNANNDDNNNNIDEVSSSDSKFNSNNKETGNIIPLPTCSTVIIASSSTIPLATIAISTNAPNSTAVITTIVTSAIDSTVNTFFVNDVNEKKQEESKIGKIRVKDPLTLGIIGSSHCNDLLLNTAVYHQSLSSNNSCISSSKTDPDLSKLSAPVSPQTMYQVSKNTGEVDIGGKKISSELVDQLCTKYLFKENKSNIAAVVEILLALEENLHQFRCSMDSIGQKRGCTTEAEKRLERSKINSQFSKRRKKYEVQLKEHFMRIVESFEIADFGISLHIFFLGIVKMFTYRDQSTDRTGRFNHLVKLLSKSLVTSGLKNNPALDILMSKHFKTNCVSILQAIKDCDNVSSDPSCLSHICNDESKPVQTDISVNQADLQNNSVTTNSLNLQVEHDKLFHKNNKISQNCTRYPCNLNRTSFPENCPKNILNCSNETSSLVLTNTLYLPQSKTQELESCKNLYNSQEKEIISGSNLTHCQLNSSNGNECHQTEEILTGCNNFSLKINQLQELTSSKPKGDFKNHSLQQSQPFSKLYSLLQLRPEEIRYPLQQKAVFPHHRNNKFTQDDTLNISTSRSNLSHSLTVSPSLGFYKNILNNNNKNNNDIPKIANLKDNIPSCTVVTHSPNTSVIKTVGNISNSCQKKFDQKLQSENVQTAVEESRRQLLNTTKNDIMQLINENDLLLTSAEMELNKQFTTFKQSLGDKTSQDTRKLTTINLPREGNANETFDWSSFSAFGQSKSIPDKPSEGRLNEDSCKENRSLFRNTTNVSKSSPNCVTSPWQVFQCGSSNSNINRLKRTDFPVPLNLTKNAINNRTTCSSSSQVYNTSDHGRVTDHFKGNNFINLRTLDDKMCLSRPDSEQTAVNSVLQMIKCASKDCCNSATVMCGGCHKTYYCGVECQIKDWHAYHCDACRYKM